MPFGEPVENLLRYDALPVGRHVHAVGRILLEKGLKRMVDVDDLPSVSEGNGGQFGNQPSEAFVASGIFWPGLGIVHGRRCDEDTAGAGAAHPSRAGDGFEQAREVVRDFVLPIGEDGFRIVRAQAYDDRIASFFDALLCFY